MFFIRTQLKSDKFVSESNPAWYRAEYFEYQLNCKPTKFCQMDWNPTNMPESSCLPHRLLSVAGAICGLPCCITEPECETLNPTWTVMSYRVRTVISNSNARTHTHTLYGWKKSHKTWQQYPTNCWTSVSSMVTSDWSKYSLAFWCTWNTLIYLCKVL